MKWVCMACSLEDVTRVISIDSCVQCETKFIHLRSKAPYTEAEVCYASPYAIEIIVNTHWYHCYSNIQNLLRDADWNSLVSSLCRYIFDAHVKKVLEKGGEFDCRELVAVGTEKKPTVKITVPPSSEPAIVVTNVATDQKYNQLYVTNTSNFTLIDAWIPGFGAFLLAVGKKHDVKDGTTDEIGKLGRDAYRLFWLLPPLYFDNFVKKKKPTKFDFEQFAIRIPYPEVVHPNWEKYNMEDEESETTVED